MLYNTPAFSSDEGWETRIKTFVYLSITFREVTNLFI